MLTCTDVEDLLPGIAAGEESDEPVREHVAACETCRAARDRIAADVGRMREGLALLSPSPFLEDAVARAAREGRKPARVSRRSLWLGAGLALAAAALLVAVLPRDPAPKGAGDGKETPKGDGKGAPAAIRIPPSADEVSAARAKNALPFDRPEPIPVKRVALAGDRSEASEGFPPPWEGVLQRWVYGDPDAQFGRRTLGLGAAPRDGVMSMGNELMALLDAQVVIDPDEGVFLRVGEKRWGAIGGGNEAELFIGSPDEGGTEARVRVVIATGYSGTLLLEGPIARALELSQFEIPGGFEIGEGHDIQGQRARARVRIPELGFDGVVEVQVRADVTPNHKGDTQLPGLTPQQIRYGAAATVRDDGGVVVGAGGVTMTIHSGRMHGMTGLDEPYNPSLLFDDGTWMFWRQLGPKTDGLPAEVAISTVTLVEAIPGATRFLVARAWRERTAVPTREPVVAGSAGADGRISFPRLPGEAGDTLRMLVWKTDGSSEFRDVSFATAPMPLQVEIEMRDAAIQVQYVDPERGTEWRRAATLSLSDRSDAGTVQALVRLRDLLLEIARESGGAERLRSAHLKLTPTAEMPWQWVIWVLQTGAPLGIRDITYQPPWGDEPIDQPLPKDEGVHQRQPIVAKDAKPIRLVLLGSQGTEPLLVKVDKVPVDGGLAAREALVQAIRGRAQTLGEGAFVEIAAPPPRSATVTFRDVYEAMKATRDAGVKEFRLEGHSMPQVPR